MEKKLQRFKELKSYRDYLMSEHQYYYDLWHMELATFLLQQWDKVCQEIFKLHDEFIKYWYIILNLK